MFTRVLFALSILAVIALLWAGISMAQHVRRARRKRRRADRTDPRMGSGILAIPDAAPAAEAGFSFAELTPYREAAVSRIESPSAPRLSWTPEPAESDYSEVESFVPAPVEAGDAEPVTPYADDPVFAEFLTQVDERLQPRPGLPEIFADEPAVPLQASKPVNGLFHNDQPSDISFVKAQDASWFPLEVVASSIPLEPIVPTVNERALPVTPTPLPTPFAAGPWSEPEASETEEEPQILFRTLNIVREAAPEPLFVEVEEPEVTVASETAALNLTAAEEAQATAAAAIPIATQPFAHLPKPPQSAPLPQAAVSKPSYARLGKKLARPDWDYFNKDMGDLTDPYESTRSRVTTKPDRTGT